MDVREIAELGSLSAQGGLRAWLEPDGDDHVLVLGDEDGRIEIEAAIGPRADAVRALKEVAGVILAWAAQLERPPVPRYPRPGEAPPSWT